MSFEEDGERFSMYYLKPTSQMTCAAACWRTKVRTNLPVRALAGSVSTSSLVLP